MKCGYCGRECPDGTVYCECGRPLTYNRDGSPSFTAGGDDAGSAAYASGSKQKPSVLRTVIMLILAAALVLLFIIGKSFFEKRMDEKVIRDINDTSTWQTIDTAQFSMKAPSCLKEGEMINIPEIQGNSTGLVFYYSKHVALAVSFYSFTSEEKEIFGSLTAAESEEVLHSNKVLLSWLNRSFAPREGKDYVYYETDNYYCSYIGNGEKEDTLYIEGKYATPDGWYFVETYTLLEDKDELRDEILEMLDSFTIK